MVPFHKKQWHHIWVKNWYLREVDGVSDRMLFYLGGKKEKNSAKYPFCIILLVLARPELVKQFTLK